jgi:hypothetical protein
VRDLIVTNEWDLELYRKRLKDVFPLVTAAYVIATPAKVNMDKLEGVTWIIEEVAKKDLRLTPDTLQATWAKLLKLDYFGPFTAYEIASDLRHTYVCRDASDIRSWASFGPGAGRGMSRVMGLPVDTLDYRRVLDHKCLLDNALTLLRMSEDPAHWPQEWPRWEMREVEHTLCEFDKYERTRLGEGTPKQAYGGRKRKSYRRKKKNRSDQ